jgi:pilus assembly protein CpaE
MPVFLFQADGDGTVLDDVERRLRTGIPDLKRVLGLEDVGKHSIRAPGRLFAIMVAPSAEQDFRGLMDTINGHKNVFFVVFGSDLSALHYKQLLQSGNADWVAETTSPQEILAIFHRAGAASRTSPSKQPVVVSFLPSAGGVGNSTLAMETAIQLTRRKGARDGKVALIDLDFQTSHICDYLDIQPKFRIEEIRGAPERLDDQLLNVFASRHASGVEIFAVPRSRLAVRDLGVEELSALFERMANHYPTIIVDMPVAPQAWTIPVLTASEGILVTGINSIPGLRQMSETLQAVRAEGGVSADVRAIVNRCAASFLGRIEREDHIARILREERRFYVRESRAAIECANMGESITLARPSDKAVKDIAAIAHHCAALKPLAARQVDAVVGVN